MNLPKACGSGMRLLCAIAGNHHIGLALNCIFELESVEGEQFVIETPIAVAFPAINMGKERFRAHFPEMARNSPSVQEDVSPAAS